MSDGDSAAPVGHSTASRGARPTVAAPKPPHRGRKGTADTWRRAARSKAKRRAPDASSGRAAEMIAIPADGKSTKNPLADDGVEEEEEAVDMRSRTASGRVVRSKRQSQRTLDSLDDLGDDSEEEAGGCCRAAMHVCGSSDNPFKEIFLYIFFYALLMFVAVYQRPSLDSYYFNALMADLIVEEEFPDQFAPNLYKSFHDVATTEEFWQFVQGPLAGNLFPDDCYGGVDDATMKPAESCAGFVYFGNRIIGGVRLRQVRVKEQSCAVPQLLRGDLKGCYPPYSSSVALDTGNIFEGNISTVPPSLRDQLTRCFTYNTPAFRLTATGQRSDYPEAGYACDLLTGQAGVHALMKSLEETEWVDISTRAVFVDTAVFNPNVNLFCIVRLMFEFLPTGGVLPSATFRTGRLTPFLTFSGYLYAGLEVLVLLFVCYYVLGEYRKMREAGVLTFLSEPFNVIVVLNLLLFFFFFGVRIYVYLASVALLDSSNLESYVNMQDIGFWYSMQEYALGFNVVLSTVKMFRYVQVSDRLSLLVRTFQKGTEDMLYFLVVLMLLLIGYAMAFYIVYGTNVEGFRTLPLSIFTLFKSLLGEFGFVDDVQKGNRYLGPFLFLTYMFFVAFICLSMFFAIVDDAFEEVKNEVQEAAGEDPLVAEIKKRTRQFVNAIRNKLSSNRAVVTAATKFRGAVSRVGSSMGFRSSAPRKDFGSMAAAVVERSRMADPDVKRAAAMLDASEKLQNAAARGRGTSVAHVRDLAGDVLDEADLRRVAAPSSAAGEAVDAEELRELGATASDRALRVAMKELLRSSSDQAYRLVTLERQMADTQAALEDIASSMRVVQSLLRKER
eukprot:PLAT11123.1.p1 GENE.PLAT11123.1~~PLAT11123.1.p1  ORF type:complete len:840 (+),score=465.31 PLAT11123.1:32-2551(+)